MESVICPIGITLLFGIPIAVIVYLFRRDQQNLPDGIPNERRTFYIFLIATIATGFVIALGIVFKSDAIFIIGFLIFGIFAAVRGVRYFMKIANQDSSGDKLE